MSKGQSKTVGRRLPDRGIMCMKTGGRRQVQRSKEENVSDEAGERQGPDLAGLIAHESDFGYYLKPIENH